MLFVSWQLFVKLRVMWNSTENHAIESYFSSNTWQTISYSYVHITVCDKYQVPWKRVLFSQRQHLNIWQSLDQGTVCTSKRKYDKVTNLIQYSKGGTFQTNQSKSFHLHQSNLTFLRPCWAKKVTTTGDVYKKGKKTKTKFFFPVSTNENSHSLLAFTESWNSAAKLLPPVTNL